MRRLKVLLRVWLRAAVRYFTGRRWTVALPDKRKIFVEETLAFYRTAIAEHDRRKVNNRDLLTGMIVALIAGPNIAYSGWEYYKAHSRQPKNGAKGKTTRWVGRPSVYVSGSNKTKVGMTEFIQDYVPRREQLAAKGRRKYL